MFLASALADVGLRALPANQRDKLGDVVDEDLLFPPFGTFKHTGVILGKNSTRKRL